MKNNLLASVAGLFCAVFCALFLNACAPAQNQMALVQGPLKVSRENPRYFTDGSGKAIYLTGSHTWDNLVDMGTADFQAEFDFPRYLHWMKEYNHNFMRLWTWELMNWETEKAVKDRTVEYFVAPHPWLRTGPGTALDGKLKFDLSQFDPVYFERLKQRVEQAADSGIYVSIMLFEGWGLQFIPNAYERHPFHPDNNINGIIGDSDGDGNCTEIHTLGNHAITSLQEGYIRKVIDVVNEFDNVLYEISNENHPPSTEWQYHTTRFIKEYEKNLAKQHPVGMTFQYKGGENSTLFNSPADWISPNNKDGYADDPPPSDGSKVIITDTDHLWGIGGNETWVWKSFLRGLNPIFMDAYQGRILNWKSDSSWVEPVRRSMGQTLMLAGRMDLIAMIPEPGLASSGYCLANAGKAYLVYLPDSLGVEVNLEKAAGLFDAEWFNPKSGQFKRSEAIRGGDKLSFHSPFGTTGTLLYLKAR
ncbi:MAG: DUF6298 domain-containing protein [Bacteroidales bacterium]